MQETSLIEQGIKRRLNAYRTRTKKLYGYLPDNVVDLSYLLGLYHGQDGLCFYTGIKLDASGSGFSLAGLHLDKIEPSKGYVKGNVVWASKFCNCGRGDSKQEEFKQFLDEAVKTYVKRHTATY
jgi:hypothetical protein